MEVIELPTPNLVGNMFLEETLSQRRSRRTFSNVSLALADLSQLLWAAQGITHVSGKRTAPSAGALYPLEIYVVVGSVESLSQGVYHYDPEANSVNKILDGDMRQELLLAAGNQSAVGNAAIDIVITAVYERTTQKYGDRGIRYVVLEAGHVAQNIYLQCESLGFNTVSIGSFNDQEVKNLLNIEEDPLYIMPVGHPE
ncbi:MAG: SagB/ThcOx family dehydrogenase [Candidatus Aminicenantes bacterium]|nr:SagB/ThcOx family dehydrogenase [Candidatus Aminicenantes bacterium]